MIGEILGVVGEVLTGAAVIVTAGIFVPSDTSLDKSSRNLRVKLIESLQQYVNQENDVLSDAIKRGDFSLIEEKAPKLLEAILNIANSDPEKAVGLFKIAYGQTVEALVADLISNDPLLSQYLEKLGGANKEDFRGIGLLQGLVFDITTVGGVAAHKDPEKRPYGENLIVIPYKPPWQDDPKNWP